MQNIIIFFVLVLFLAACRQPYTDPQPVLAAQTTPTPLTPGQLPNIPGLPIDGTRTITPQEAWELGQRMPIVTAIPSIQPGDKLGTGWIPSESELQTAFPR